MVVKEELLKYHCKFYHPTKDRNQYSICRTFLVEVDSSQVDEVSEEELQKHSIVRLTPDEFLKRSNNDTTIYVVKELL